ncbi:hypothetical protein GCM10009547_47380 [Sporichthya brevicatena]|uniref:Apea-like HEPN domain-containing protein n=1 Tax=Sporichthya brevicatena TaxID=171442 RepID=A0ABN1HD09_9ACTN
MDNSHVRFGVVLNHVAIDSDLPWQIGGWTLDRATRDEVDQFRELLIGFVSQPYAAGQPAQEFRLELEGNQVRPHPLAKEDWRYLVLRPTASAVHWQQLTEAARLANTELLVELWATQGPVRTSSGAPALGTMYDQSQCVRFFSSFRSAWPIPTARPDSGELHALVELRAALDQTQYADIARLISDFRTLDVVPDPARIKLLGYFGVIEGLLTHNPALGDASDSISKQLQRNLAIVNSILPDGFSTHLEEFAGATLSQVTSELYNYRSRIAHGGSGDRAVRWLTERRPPQTAEWADHDWMHSFVRHLTKCSLIAALTDPEACVQLRRRPA